MFKNFLATVNQDYYPYQYIDGRWSPVGDGSPTDNLGSMLLILGVVSALIMVLGSFLIQPYLVLAGSIFAGVGLVGGMVIGMYNAHNMEEKLTEWAYTRYGVILNQAQVEALSSQQVVSLPDGTNIVLSQTDSRGQLIAVVDGGELTVKQ